MPKNNQYIAFIILIPMLLFTFIVTVKSDSYTINQDDPKQIIYKYYEYKNQKNINAISELLYNKDEINNIKLQLSSLNQIHVTTIKEDKNKSLLNIYLKSNYNVKDVDEIKVYKVIYNVSYNTKGKYKNGEYESWCFLIKKNKSSEWLLDPYDNY